MNLSEKKHAAGCILVLAAVIVRGQLCFSSDDKVTVTDSTGAMLSFTHPPQRIVSLNPDCTENVVALGAGGRLVGITDYCRFPDNLPAPERVGGLWHPNLERIVVLRPDLVLATREGNNPEIISAIRNLSIPVYVSGQPAGFRDYFLFLRRLGSILDRESQAAALIEETASLIDRLREQSAGRPPQSVFFQVGTKPLITAGPDTLIGEMIEIAGGKNIAGDLSARYPAVSRERVLAEDPGVIIIAASGSEAEEGAAFWKSFPELAAVRQGRVFLIDPDHVCRLGPGLREGLLEIVSCISGEGEKK